MMPDQPTDAELLRRYAEEKSEPAFAELVRRHLGFVHAGALRRVGGDAHLAEDVAQQVFTALARDAARLSRRPVLIGWLFITTRFSAARTVRAERRRHAREQEAHAMHDYDAPSRAGEDDWNRLRPEIDATLDRLNDRDREAILLRFFEGRSFAEVGERLRLSENAARMRVERALDKLHALLAQRGVTSTSAALGLVLATQAGAAAPAGLVASVTGAALADAGGALASGMTLFMMTTKHAWGIAAVMTLLAVATAIHYGNTTREAVAARNVLIGERDALRARVVLAEKRAAGLSVIAPKSDLAAGRGAVTPRQNIAATGWTTSAIDYVLDHPETRSLHLQRAVLSIKARFDPFFRVAGLTGDQQDRFLRLAMDDAEGRLDALAMRRAAGGLGAGGTGMDALEMERISAFQRQRDEELTKNMRELLGAQFEGAMQNLNTMQERNVADELASRLYYTDAPLTDVQANRLIAVLAENRYRSESDTIGGTRIPRENYNGTLADPMKMAMPWLGNAPVTDAAVARAATVLAPTQLAALKAFQAQQAADLRLVPPVRAKDRTKGQ